MGALVKEVTSPLCPMNRRVVRLDRFSRLIGRPAVVQAVGRATVKIQMWFRRRRGYRADRLAARLARTRPALPAPPDDGGTERTDASRFICRTRYRLCRRPSTSPPLEGYAHWVGFFVWVAVLLWCGACATYTVKIGVDFGRPAAQEWLTAVCLAVATQLALLFPLSAIAGPPLRERCRRSNVGQPPRGCCRGKKKAKVSAVGSELPQHETAGFAGSADEVDAASLIQSMQRGKQARRDMQEQKAAATKLQSLQRGKMARRQRRQEAVPPAS